MSGFGSPSARCRTWEPVPDAIYRVWGPGTTAASGRDPPIGFVCTSVHHGDRAKNREPQISQIGTGNLRNSAQSAPSLPPRNSHPGACRLSRCPAGQVPRTDTGPRSSRRRCWFNSKRYNNPSQEENGGIPPPPGLRWEFRLQTGPRVFRRSRLHFDQKRKADRERREPPSAAFGRNPENVLSQRHEDTKKRDTKGPWGSGALSTAVTQRLLEDASPQFTNDVDTNVDPVADICTYFC